LALRQSQWVNHASIPAGYMLHVTEISHQKAK
jgi:hypothetical protein